MANGATSPLVPSISPLIESLRQFTPRAKEERAFELAGLESQQDLRQAQTQQIIEKTKQQQILNQATQMLTVFSEDDSDLTFLLKDGPEGLRNNISQLAGTKDKDSDDIAELVQAANMAVSDPDRAFSELTRAFDDNKKKLDVVNTILKRNQKGAQVKSSDILPDGTTIQVMNDGSTRVTDPEGKPLRGKDRTAAIVKGREFGVDIQTRRAGGRAEAVADVQLRTQPTIAASTAAAKAAIKRSEDAFDKIAPIKRSVANIDEAISLIDQGAETGVIAARLPSVRSASIQLDNLQGKLGLDVISNTTFGALSEAELKFALSTALPKTLEGPDLKKWLQRKKETQQKLAAYLERVATFLGTPGNTVKDFIELEQLNELDRETTQPAAQPVTPATTGIRFLGFE